MGDSFTADPSAIFQLGSEFEDQARALASSVPGFSGSAFSIGEAFGLLGACDGALSKYMAMLKNTVNGLEQLAEVWDRTGQQLQLTARAYLDVDTECAQSFAEIGGGAQ
ncbi:hypothetical protein KDL01_18565 [Actinospica durhamensis]|uniref:Excreted virulence factor EspC (Type VII ESX diderm) n=1 Tax=Actinospica durhamensis TaxID=1508375 RepID=A0A941EUH1_9ACTN|nr:hypothetical protein [Actinospica durhamensis]MBR7835284.1 hypothetical protein [Actinospica durhamensis]